MQPSKSVAFMLAIALFAICVQNSVALENELKSKVYLSSKIPQHPGSVSKKYYYDIEFPKGHIALKSFNAEVVDELGNPVPLLETYLHHWITLRYYQRKGVEYSDLGSDVIHSRNAGICDHGLSQFFGLGSETRKTSTVVPDPYGIEVGNPLKVPDGYEEKWLFNIHAIDTRGTVDAMGCTECRCDLYNVTKDENGEPLKPNYVGGIDCCYDGTQCKLKNGIERVERNLYLRYTVKWVDWSDVIIPVDIFILDVTDPWQYTGIHACHVEYDIEKSTTGVVTNDFTTTKSSSVILPIEGDIVYAVAHQHSGGIGSTLYGKDGRVICISNPIYGQGNSAGDEAGYIVGRSTCYPKPGSMRIAKGEALTMESTYNNEKRHTGVMGHFYILVANTSLNSNEFVNIHEELKVTIIYWGVIAFGSAISIALFVTCHRRYPNEDGYVSIAT